MTITAYMGEDVLAVTEPWLKLGFEAYLVLLSSNPSGFQFQNEKMKENNVAELLWARVSKYIGEKKLQESIGLVIGAQYYSQEKQELITSYSNTHS